MLHMYLSIPSRLLGVVLLLGYVVALAVLPTAKRYAVDTLSWSNMPAPTEDVDE